MLNGPEAELSAASPPSTDIRDIEILKTGISMGVDVISIIDLSSCFRISVVTKDITSNKYSSNNILL